MKRTDRKERSKGSLPSRERSSSVRKSSGVGNKTAFGRSNKGERGHPVNGSVRPLPARDRVSALPMRSDSPAERINMKPGALTAPLPPVIVSVKSGDEVNLITIGWTGILATHPPKTYISVRPERHSFKMIKESSEFVINLPTVKMARAVDYAGIYTGAKVNKLERTGLTPVESLKVSAPSLAESPLSLECRVSDILEMGTHHVFVADIVNVSASPEILDTDGRLRYDKADLLAYAHGEYYALGDKLGSFGFSTDKTGKTGKKSGSKGAPSQKGEKDEGKEVKRDEGK